MTAQPVRRGPGQIGTSKEAQTSSVTNDDWFRSYDQKTRMDAALGSECLRERCKSAGQTLPTEGPRRRLTFEEQLALVASGRAKIVDMDGRA